MKDLCLVWKAVEVKNFYKLFLAWIKEALCFATIIVVEGNP